MLDGKLSPLVVLILVTVGEVDCWEIRHLYVWPLELDLSLELKWVWRLWALL